MGMPISGARAALFTVTLVAALTALTAPAVRAQSAPAAPAAAAPGAAVAPADYEKRLKKLSEELRCLVCQNQTLADSSAGLAQDLRRQVEDLMAQGKTDDQIKTFLVERYGDFVLYRPPMQSNTVFLWVGPFALLLVGGIAWAVVQRRSRQQRAGEAVAAGSAPADRERARKLLGD